MTDSDIPSSRKQHLTAEEILEVYREQVLAIGKALEPFRQHALAIGKALEPFRQHALAIGKALEPFRQHALAIGKALEPFQRQLSANAKVVGQLVEENRRVIEGFRKWVQDQPKRDWETQKALEKLAEFGWYCDPEMSWTAPVQLAHALSEKDTGEVVEAISKYFHQRLDAIEEKLKTHYPHRRHVLHDAFNAHREGKYNLSVPVFLAQADGIWWEKFSKNLFKREGRMIADDCILQIKNDFYRPMFRLFQTSIPLWKTESERDSSFDELNRHQVLHGEAVNYGTELNSLKIISFLSYLCWVLNCPTKRIL